MSRKIGIVGSGLTGRAWAMLFASAGYQVVIYNLEPEKIDSALEDIEHQLKTLEENGVLRGNLSSSEQFACIEGTIILQDAVTDALLIQECVPEIFDLKRKVWKGIDDIAGPDTIFSSSTSTFLPSLFSDHLKYRQNIIVSHPVNPTYYVPLVEIVPAPWTEPWVTEKTREIMEEIGQTPVTLSKEIPGFAVNRLQFALLNEAWNLVADGILDVKDIDRAVTEGLGMRYALVGPLESTHLMAEGFADYCRKYGNTIFSVSQDFKSLQKWVGPLVDEIAKQLESSVPLHKLQERREWRNLALTKLGQFKKTL